MTPYALSYFSHKIVSVCRALWLWRLHHPSRLYLSRVPCSVQSWDVVESQVVRSCLVLAVLPSWLLNMSWQIAVSFWPQAEAGLPPWRWHNSFQRLLLSDGSVPKSWAVTARSMPPFAVECRLHTFDVRRTISSSIDASSDKCLCWYKPTCQIRESSVGNCQLDHGIVVFGSCLGFIATGMDDYEHDCISCAPLATKGSAIGGREAI